MYYEKNKTKILKWKTAVYGRLCIRERESEVCFLFSPRIFFPLHCKKKGLCKKIHTQKHSVEFIYYMKPFKMILSWGRVTGNKAGESVLFCRDRSLRKKKERELRQCGHLWSEPQWNRRKHYQPCILKKWFQSQKFYCVFYMSVVTSLIFRTRTLCHYWFRVASGFSTCPIYFKDICFHTKKKTSGTTSY